MLSNISIKMVNIENIINKTNTNNFKLVVNVREQVSRGQFYQRSVSSFYALIPKVQKDSKVVSLLCAFGICATRRMLMKLTQGRLF